MRLHCARGAHRHSQLRAGRLTKFETQKEVSCSGNVLYRAKKAALVSMVVIEDMMDMCVHAPNEGGLELEDNPGEGAVDDGSTSHADGLRLEDNEHVATGDDDDDDDDGFADGEEVWEISFSTSVREKPPVDEIVEVRLFRKGDERLGLVLDATNVVVALREGTPAAQSGEIFVSDTVLAVQGVACSAERRVAQLLRELPDAAVYAFTIRRSLAPKTACDGGALASDAAAHGPLPTPEEAEALRDRELEARQRLREELAASGPLSILGNSVSAEERAAVEVELCPRDLRESRYASARAEMSPATKQQLQQMWLLQARSNLAHRLAAAEMLKVQ